MSRRFSRGRFFASVVLIGFFFTSVPPVQGQDPGHAYVPNNIGREPTYRIADLSNPNLKPWVKERMKKDNDEVLAGKIAFTARSSCMPAGVPAFVTYPVRPVYFVQTPPPAPL